MAQGFTPLRSRVLGLLIDAGTWVTRAEVNTLSTCAPAIDDALADLVQEGLAVFRHQVGYRLAAGEAARRAAQLQRRSGKRMAAAGLAGREFYTVGVAEIRPELGLLLYELQLPNPEPGPKALSLFQEQLQGVMNFVNARGGEHA